MPAFLSSIYRVAEEGPPREFRLLAREYQLDSARRLFLVGYLGRACIVVLEMWISAEASPLCCEIYQCVRRQSASGPRADSHRISSEPMNHGRRSAASASFFQQPARAVQRLSSATRRAESRPSRIGPISFWRETNGGAQSARCVRRGGDWRRGCGSGPRATPARHPSTLPMSGVWKRGHGRTSKPPPNERGGNRYVRT
jgi:hypothetical protein